ncbi:MAG TPA: NUDIX domain-containing protein [Labilithrix sp.]|nr:NUDIX domain-containing protein [Labilithrix sp.]
MSLHSVPFAYPFPRPAVTCDAVVFTMRAGELAVLLIRRKEAPFKGSWALPGGYVNENESIERAAARELSEETGITGARLEQIGAFGDPGRDPRGHTITIAYLSFLVAEPKITPGDDAVDAQWHAYRSLVLNVEVPPSRTSAKRTKRSSAVRRPAPRPSTSGHIQLAFDHARIVSLAYRRLCQHLEDPIRDRTFDLLPSRFTLTELQHFYEVVLGRKLPQRAFKKRLLDKQFVVPASSKPTRKPADQLYRWNRPR